MNRIQVWEHHKRLIFSQVLTIHLLKERSNRSLKTVILKYLRSYITLSRINNNKLYKLKLYSFESTHNQCRKSNHCKCNIIYNKI